MNRELLDASPLLVDNADLLRGILSGSGDCIKILDLDGRLQFMSEGGKRVMEVDDFGALKGCPWPDFWKGTGNAQAMEAVATAKAGGTARFQNAANTARGTPRFWDVQVSPILGPDGAVTHLLSISRDITVEWSQAERARKTAEHQIFLTQELTHRVKNTLATVAAISNQTFKDAVHRDAREVFNARLQSLSAAYNVLSQASWADTDIRAIVDGALAPYRAGNGRFEIAGPRVDVSSGRAFMLALALNELATNAMKYGALSNNEGRVRLSWAVEDTDSGPMLTLDWIESGGPEVAPPTRTGFGSRLIKSMLASEFRGSVDIQYAPSGLTCRLRAPARSGAMDA